MKVIAFVPARGGSTRTPRKNLQKIGGLPLFLRACYNLHQILEKKDIVVDSDDDEILQIACDYGFNTLKRPDDLATNATDGNAFFRWETSNYKNYDIFIQHLPPMAFLSKQTLQAGINAISKEGFDSIVCVGKEHFYLWDENSGKPLYDLVQIPNSFSLKNTIIETMGLYIISADIHFKKGMRIGNNYKFIEVSKIEQTDIDYPADLELARAIENGLPDNNSYKSHNLRYRDIIENIKNIKLIVCDVDGVLTDGKMIYSENGDELKNFNTRDGIAAKLLKKAGYKLTILSSGICNNLINRRGKFLDYDKIVITDKDKGLVLDALLNEMHLEYENVLYIGDDINDLESMKKCKISCCPCDAHKEVQNISHIVLSTTGVSGCLREVADLIFGGINK